jgi:hypothetical protein
MHATAWAMNRQQAKIAATLRADSGVTMSEERSPW